MIITKWILIMYMYGYREKALDHIEFKTQHSCFRFAEEVEKQFPQSYCKCLEVRE